jgi:transcriptional regulator with XRE-family HTH domain
MTFDAKLRLVCALLDWTQSTLTEQLCASGYCVSATTVRRWWRGMGDPKRKDLLALSELLDVSIEVLARDELDIDFSNRGGKLSNMRTGQKAKSRRTARGPKTA